MVRQRPPLKPRKMKARTRKRGGSIRTDPRSTWTPEYVERICDLLAVGKTMKFIASLPLMPSYMTLMRWELDDVETGRLFASAREIGTHFRADECIEIADEEVFDQVDVQRNRLRIETRMRLNGMWNRKAYGEAKFAQLPAVGGDQPNVTTEQEAETNKKLAAIRDKLASAAKHIRGGPKLVSVEGKPVIEGKAVGR